MLYRFGPFEAETATGELRKHGTRMRLPDQAFSVLVAVLERPGELVTREEIVKRLWPQGTFVDYDHSLNTALNRLREVLGDSAASPQWIETLPKRGYRFIGVVEAPNAATIQVAQSVEKVASGELPSPSRKLVRTLFLLTQIMYLGFYIAALVNWGEIHWLVGTVVGSGAAPYITAFVLSTAMVGIPLRLFLLTAVGWDYRGFRAKYERIFPLVAAMDLSWGVSPMLTAHHIGMGITLAVSAMLLYLTFGQRTLVDMAYPMNQGQTTSVG